MTNAQPAAPPSGSDSTEERRPAAPTLGHALAPARDRGDAGQRAVRGRPQHGGQGAGGPGLVRRGQPAPRADRDDGRPRCPRPRRDHPDRRGDGRAQPRVQHGPADRPQGPRRPRLQAPAAVPRGVGRGAGPPVRAGPAQPPAAGRRAAGRRHRGRARAARPAARRRGPDRRHLHGVGAGHCAACWSGPSARPSRRPRGSRSSRSASSTGCRWTPTSSWTSGSCRTRTGSPSCASTPAATATCATTSSARRAPASSSTATWSCWRWSEPGTGARASAT